MNLLIDLNWIFTATEVDAAVGEKRKSVAAEDVTISPKKAKVDENEAAVPVVDDVVPVV